MHHVYGSVRTSTLPCMVSCHHVYPYCRMSGRLQRCGTANPREPHQRGLSLVALHDPRRLEYLRRSVVSKQRRCDPEPFDGVLLVNPATMFAVRLCQPEVTFLTPLLRHRTSASSLGRATMGPQFDPTILGPECGAGVFDRCLPRARGPCILPLVEGNRQWAARTPICERIRGHVVADPLAGGERATVDRVVDGSERSLGSHTMGRCVRYVSSLCLEEFERLDKDLQRLYILLLGCVRVPRTPATGLRIRRGRWGLASDQDPVSYIHGSPGPGVGSAEPQVRRLGGERVARACILARGRVPQRPSCSSWNNITSYNNKKPNVRW